MNPAMSLDNSCLARVRSTAQRQHNTGRVTLGHSICDGKQRKPCDRRWPSTVDPDRLVAWKCLKCDALKKREAGTHKCEILKSGFLNGPRSELCWMMIASSHTSLTLSTTHLQFSLQRPGTATTGFGRLKYRGVYYSTHGGFDKRSSATFLARLLVSLQTYFDGPLIPIESVQTSTSFTAPDISKCPNLHSANRILATGWSSCHRPHPPGHPVAALPGQVTVKNCRMWDTNSSPWQQTNLQKEGSWWWPQRLRCECGRACENWRPKMTLSIILTYLNDVK